MLRKALPPYVEPRLLARDGVLLEGSLPLSRFARAAECLCDSDREVKVRLQFQEGPRDSIVIMGSLSTRVAMECQYCLERVEVDLQAAVDVVASESDERVQELSDTCEAMLLSGDRVPLVSLIEDDLILSLPMVPRHGAGECIEKLGYRSEEEVADHPFAALAKLREKLGTRGGRR